MRYITESEEAAIRASCRESAQSGDIRNPHKMFTTEHLIYDSELTRLELEKIKRDKSSRNK